MNPEVHQKSSVPIIASIMSPGVLNGEPAVGSDVPKEKGKATPDTIQ